MIVRKLFSRPDAYRLWCNDSDLRFIREVFYNTVYGFGSDVNRARDFLSKFDSVL